MTLLTPMTVRCAVCRTESRQAEIRSSSQFGSPDLDLRPAEMARSTMHVWVQRCPGCGYCHDSISELVDGADAVVQSAEYRTLLETPSISELAVSFRCQSAIDRHAGRLGDAARDLISSAWAYDDAPDERAAATLRREAIELLDRAADAGESVFSDPDSQGAVRIDLLRRSGAFEEADQAALAALAIARDGTVMAVLRFQSNLAEASDASCYTIQDAVDAVDADGGRPPARIDPTHLEDTTYPSPPEDVTW